MDKTSEAARKSEAPGGCQGCGCCDGRSWDVLAERVVQVCAGVKEGEVVQLGGGIHAFELLEALALAVRRAGAYPEINATSHRLLSRTVAETPLQYLSRTPEHRLRWLEDVDVIIATDSLIDPDAVAGISPERREALARGQQPLQEAVWQRGIRSLYIPYPNETLARRYGQPLEELMKAFRASLDVDYYQLSRHAQQLVDLLQRAHTVRIAAPDGTDLTVELSADRPVVVNDGRLGEDGGEPLYAQLPAGTVTLAPREDSAQGRWCVPVTFLEADEVRGLELRFKDGRVEDARAEQGLRIVKSAMAYGPPELQQVGRLSFGLNPGLSTALPLKASGADAGSPESDSPRGEEPVPYGVTGYEVLDLCAQGAVSLTLGENRMVGGLNGGDVEWTLTVPRASVWLDGRLVMEQGRWCY